MNFFKDTFEVSIYPFQGYVLNMSDTGGGNDKCVIFSQPPEYGFSILELIESTNQTNIIQMQGSLTRLIMVYFPHLGPVFVVIINGKMRAPLLIAIVDPPLDTDG